MSAFLSLSHANRDDFRLAQFLTGLIFGGIEVQAGLNLSCAGAGSESAGPTMSRPALVSGKAMTSVFQVRVR